MDVAGTIGFTVQQVFLNGSIIGFFQAQGNLLGKGETTGRVYTGKDFTKQTFQFTASIPTVWPLHQSSVDR